MHKPICILYIACLNSTYFLYFFIVLRICVNNFMLYITVVPITFVSKIYVIVGRFLDEAGTAVDPELTLKHKIKD